VVYSKENKYPRRMPVGGSREVSVRAAPRV
jgi:hypothetical protein